MKNSIDSNAATSLTAALFIIYLVLLVWILILKLGVRFSYMESRRFNLVPFREALVLHGRIDFGEAIANVLIFVPFGVYTGILFKGWNAWKKALLFFAFGFLTEAFQFIFRIGAFDINDIITNVLGAMLGLMLFYLVQRLFKSALKLQQFVNVMAATGTIFMVILLILLKLNMLPVRYQ